MKYLAFVGLLIVGVLIGYFIGTRQDESVSEDLADTTDFFQDIEESTPKNKPKDKPVILEEVQEDSLVDQFENDSILALEELTDTLSEEVFIEDTLNEEEELNIKRDRMISSRRVPIIYLEEKEEKDSVIKDLLGINENRPAEMVIQFWESPLGYSGYKLSRNTLVLYGLSEQFKYTIYFKKNVHYLATKELFYVLKETNDFLSFKSANRTEILND